jgi:hypothetical protein
VQTVAIVMVCWNGKHALAGTASWEARHRSLGMMGMSMYVRPLATLFRQ